MDKLEAPQKAASSQSQTFAPEPQELSEPQLVNLEPVQTQDVSHADPSSASLTPITAQATASTKSLITTLPLPKNNMSLPLPMKIASR